MCVCQVMNTILYVFICRRIVSHFMRVGSGFGAEVKIIHQLHRCSLRCCAVITVVTYIYIINNVSSYSLTFKTLVEDIIKVFACIYVEAIHGCANCS